MLPKKYTWIDIVDITTRVFHQKFKALKKLIFVQQILGQVECYAYSLELQQRGTWLYHFVPEHIHFFSGMPHAHVIMTFREGFKLDSQEKVDRLVWV